MKNLINEILPGATIGIIGGGQLGQMMALSAKEMNYRVIALDPSFDCPASKVVDQLIVSEYNDLSKIIAMAKICDVLTYEFENVDSKAIQEAAKYTQIPQGIKALEVTKNRILEKEFLSKLDIPVTQFYKVNNETELQIGFSKIKTASFLKTAVGGYDGHGQIKINDQADLELARQLLSLEIPLILEQKVEFEKEISIIMARNLKGDIAMYEPIENKHQDNILKISKSPAAISDSAIEQAKKIAIKIAENLSLVGTMGIEFFVIGDQVIVNEIAPRPHNSGHLTIESYDFSQFDLHIKSICQLQLQKPRMLSHSIMINLLGQHISNAKQALVKQPSWHLHDYGKSEIKNNRKMGHITILEDDLELAENRLQTTKIWQ